MLTISAGQYISKVDNVVENTIIGKEMNEGYINWDDFLTALNITPPNQLISLQNDLFMGGGTRGGIVVEGRSSKLSWNDFAGYEKEKLFIQNLFNRFSQHNQQNKDLNRQNSNDIFVLLFL